MEVGSSPNALEFLTGGGEMGTLIRAKDWSKTPLGPVEAWPASLRTAVSIMLETHIGMHIAWGDEYIQLYNDGYRPVLGQTKHPAALGLPIRESFPEIWADFVRPKFADVMLGRSFGAENMLVPQGRNHYLEESYFTFSYSPIRDEFGRVGGVLTTETETTEHVIRERRLRTSRNVASATSTVSSLHQAGSALMQALRENAYDVPFALLYVADAGGTLARLAEHVRLDEHEAARPAEVNLAASPEQGWPLGAVLTTGAPRLLTDLPARFGPLPGGAWPERTQAAYLLPIHRLDGKPPYGVLVLGVNPRKVFDTPHREFFESLADQATRMFATISALEEERRRAEALREIDRAKTLFFSNVSHEFRTPLTLMLGPIEEALSLDGPLPAPVRENLETAHRNALRLQKLVNSLLDFSRIEAGRMRAAFAPTDLAALTADLASNFRSVIERAGMRLEVNCPPLPQPAYVDREMWEKIVLNLLSNAFKYTLEGRIAVGLAVEADQAVLRVTDTGVGIPVAELPRLFERFHRVAGSRGRSFEGTGIGLSLIRELVGLHGGTIGVESRPGEGSTFTVRVPLGKDHLPAEAVVERRGGAGGGAAAAFLTEARHLLDPHPPEGSFSGADEKAPFGGVGASAAHVLVVDDNADMRAYVQRLLEPHYRVATAPDGQTALRLVADHHPDLVLSDVMMPVMDGFELLKTLKADPQTARIPVVLLSARAGEEATIEGYEAGADDYLVKPFSANELLARVRAQLNMARLRQLAEKRLQTLFEQAPVGIAILRGPAHTFELANDFYVNFVGRHRADEIVGKPLLEALPEIDGQGFFELLTRVVETGEAIVFTDQPVQLVRNGGLETGYFNFTYQPLPAPDAGVFVIAVEVTESVLARQKIEESNRRFRQLADSMPQMVWSTRPDGYHDFYNQRWYEFTGLTYEQTKAEGWAKVLHPDDTDRAWAVWHESLATGKNYEIEYRLRRHDGAYVWQLGRALPIRDEAGTIVRWYGTCTDISEQKHAEDALRRSEERFRRVLDGMGEGFGLLAPDFTILEQNREALRLDGRPREAIIGHPHWEVYPGTETSPLGHLLKKAMAERVPVSLVHQYAWEEGHALWLEMRAYPTTDGLLAVFWRDVTERWEAQEALRRSEEKYRTLFESMDEGFCVIEFLDGPHGPLGDYVHVEANPAYERHAGIPRVVGQRLRTMVPAEADAWLARYRPVLETGHPIRFEQTLVATSRYLELAAFRLEPPERRQVAVLFTDITERKRAEAALRESDRWFRQLADSMPQIVWTAQPDGYLDYFNQRWYEFLGEDRGRGNEGWLFALHPDDRQPCLDHWRHCLQTGEPYRFEFRLASPRHPGDYCWYLAVAEPLRDEAGGILKWFGSCTNIHDQKTEAERLEKLVGERTEALQQANADLQRSNLNLTQFAYVASHDLQEPLRKIQAFGDMLLRRNGPQLDDAGRDRVRRMQDAAGRMSGLIQDLLDYSRVSTRRETFQPVNLDALLGHVRSDLEMVIREKAARLHADPLPTLSGDPTQLRQVLQNLLSNALKFSKPDVPPRLEIRHRIVAGAEVRVPGGGLPPRTRYHEISISDNGIGFDEQFADRIFEAFQRLHGRAEYSGTGIGLAIVKKVLENHHGGVSVSSRVGEGSAFRVYLPVGEEN